MNTHSDLTKNKDLHAKAKIRISEIVSSRYGNEQVAEGCGVELSRRPFLWDEREEGIDTVRTDGGEVVRLRSSAMQSIPKPGWIVVLTGGTEREGYTWTLYGLPPLN